MIRDKIWYEIADAKYGETYLALYMARCRRHRQWFKILTLVFSGSGALGWTIWEPIAFISCGLIAVMQIISLLENQIIKSDDDLAKIAELRNLYLKYLNKLEILWIDLEDGQVSNSVASNKLFSIKDKIKQRIEVIDNTMLIDGTIESLLKASDLEQKKYLNNRYGKGI